MEATGAAATPSGINPTDTRSPMGPSEIEQTREIADENLRDENATKTRIFVTKRVETRGLC